MNDEIEKTIEALEGIIEGLKASLNEEVEAEFDYSIKLGHSIFSPKVERLYLSWDDVSEFVKLVADANVDNDESWGWAIVEAYEMFNTMEIVLLSSQPGSLRASPPSDLPSFTTVLTDSNGNNYIVEIRIANIF